MQVNNTSNESSSDFRRCLGIYHLLARPTGHTFITYISVIVVLSIFSILSAVGNGLIIYVYLKQKSLQRTNTFLLVCLAFLDFVSAVLLEPFYVVRLLSEIFGFTSCVYILIVRRLLEYLRPVSFMTLALITIERYLALFKAITHRRMVTKQRLLHVVLLIWFVWFLLICIRSLFPKLTSAFYTFFTFVAFSLLVGNFCMYFKIGKLARLHSRPTRVSTAPGSLSVGYTNPRFISPRSTNQATGVMYSKTEESINYVAKGKQWNFRKIGIHPKSRKNIEQPRDKTVRLSESDVFSTEDEISHALGEKIDCNNYQATNSHTFDNTTKKKEESKDKTVENNCENETHNNKSNSKTSNEKAADVEAEKVDKRFANTSSTSTSLNTVPTSNTSVSKPECSDNDVTCTTNHQVKTDLNCNSLQRFETKDFTQENQHVTTQSKNMAKLLERKADHRLDVATQGTSCTNPSEAHGKCMANTPHDTNTNQTPNSESVLTFKTTAELQVKDINEEARQHEKATPIAKSTNFTQVKNTDPTHSSSTNPMPKIDKTNKDSPQPNTRASLKNTAKLVVETRERNATWTVFYIVAILTLCYLPIAALLVYLSFQNVPDATLLFIYVPIADTIALFNALVNPFIYCLKNRKMRAAVKSVLQRT